MKTNFLMVIAVTAVTSLTVNAQPQRMQPYSGKSPKEVQQVMRSEELSTPMGSLDDKQREEIRKIRMEQDKERMQSRNLLKEKRAKLEVLQTADKPDMKEINKVIDEIASIQAQTMKAQAASRQKIRSLLTDEQRVLFDTRIAGRENGRAEHKFRTNNGIRPENSDRPRIQRGERPQMRMEWGRPE